MKFLFASDSFKGTLSSGRTAELLTQAAEEIFPGCQCSGVEVADGGEGTTKAVLAATNGKEISVRVHGPLWEREEAYYGELGGCKVIMEMAAASGSAPGSQGAERSQENHFLWCRRNDK